MLDGSHYRTTAEIRYAPLAAVAAVPPHDDVTLPITMTVVPGESITALDIALPPSSWKVFSTNAAAVGITCSVRGTSPAASALHCAAAGGSLPAGPYPLVVTLSSGTTPAWPPESLLTLTAAGHASEPVDSFGVAFPSSAS